MRTRRVMGRTYNDRNKRGILILSPYSQGHDLVIALCICQASGERGSGGAKVTEAIHPADDDGEAALATAIIGKIGSSIGGEVGSEIGSAIGGQILGCLGLGGSTDYTSYFNAINAKLDQISGQLQQIQTGIQQLSNALVSLTGLVLASELAASLKQYEAARAVIQTCYQTFAQHIDGLISGKADTASDSAEQLYQMLTDYSESGYASQVAINLQVINSLVVGDSEYTSIVDFQPQVCYNAVTAWAQQTSNFETPEGIINYGDILPGYPGVIANTLAETVLPCLQAILTVQVQGLAFLIVAWGGTDQESSLQQYISNLQAQIAQMGKVFGQIADNDSLDSLIKELVPSTPPIMGDYPRNYFIYSLPYAVDGNQGDLARFYPEQGDGGEQSDVSNFNTMPCPLDFTWLPWGVDGPGPGPEPYNGWIPNGRFIKLPIEWGSAMNATYDYQVLAFNLGGDLEGYASSPGCVGWFSVSPDPNDIDSSMRLAVTIPNPHELMTPAPDAYNAFVTQLAAITFPTETAPT